MYGTGNVRRVRHDPPRLIDFIDGPGDEGNELGNRVTAARCGAAFAYLTGLAARRPSLPLADALRMAYDWTLSDDPPKGSAQVESDIRRGDWSGAAIDVQRLADDDELA